MTQSDLFRQELEIRAEADAFLDNGLRDILRFYGEVHPIGSYALGTMTWRDLDIALVCQPDLSVEDAFVLGRQLARYWEPHKMRFQNERLAKTPSLPEALCWAVYLGDERAGAWKFDLWILSPAQYRTFASYREGFASRMTDEARAAILRVKSTVWRHPDYRAKFTSHDIYTAVLDAGVADVPQFFEYLRRVKGYDALKLERA